MAKAELKTQRNDSSVESFLDSVIDEQQRADAKKILQMFTRVTGETAEMWGPSIIGFGNRVLKYASGRELDWLEIGFSPRKGTLTLYVLTRSPNLSAMLEKLGKHKTGKGCLYIKRLADIDEKVLERLVADALKQIRKNPREF